MKKNSFGQGLAIFLVIIGVLFVIGSIGEASEPKCIKSGCDNKQASGSSYCYLHKPYTGSGKSHSSPSYSNKSSGSTSKSSISNSGSSSSYSNKSNSTNKPSYSSGTKKSATTKKSTYDSYDDGYDDIYMDGDYDYDRYDRDSDCPNNGSWSEFLSKVHMYEQYVHWRKILVDFAKKIDKPDPEEYVDEGGWKARQGGNGIDIAERSIISYEPCATEDNAFNYELQKPITKEFYELFKPFGYINTQLGNERLGEVYVLDKKGNVVLVLQGRIGSTKLKVTIKNERLAGATSLKVAEGKIQCQLTKYQMCIGCKASVIKNKDHSTILIGSYGKGKSHLLLILLAIVSMQRTKENNEIVKSLLKKIRMVDEETFEIVSSVWNKKGRFLPVIISGSIDDVSRSFMIALNDALKRENLMNLMPDTFFSIAEDTICRWKKEYPEVYINYEKALKKNGVSINDIKNGLKVCDPKALEVFKSVYPSLMGGEQFNPLTGSEVLPMYQSVADKLREQYGYSGIYLVFDEFSKFIEGQEKHSIGGNMKFLQDMCELANESKDTQIYMTMVAHKSIKEYQMLTGLILRNFRKIYLNY